LGISRTLIQRYHDPCASATSTPNVTLTNVPADSPTSTPTIDLSTRTATPEPTAQGTATPSPTCGPDGPDLLASAYWVATCPTWAELHMITQLVGAGPVPATTMRLTNGSGNFQEFAVPSLSNNGSY